MYLLLMHLTLNYQDTFKRSDVFLELYVSTHILFFLVGIFICI
jgi:hypothetical protein